MKAIRSKYLPALVAMCGMIPTSPGILRGCKDWPLGGVTVTGDLFGTQNHGGVSPTVSMGIAMANAVGFLYDASGYDGIAIGLLLAMMASVTLLILRG